MKREEYLRAVRCADGIREEEHIVNCLEEMTRHNGDLKVVLSWYDDRFNYQEEMVPLDGNDLNALITFHKKSIEKYETDFKGI